jgi:hypothetical protein
MPLFASNNHRETLEALGAFEALALTISSPPTSSPRALPRIPSTNSGVGSNKKIGRKLIADGKNSGKFRPGDGRCETRVKVKRRGKDGRAAKTTWRRALHPDVPPRSNHNSNCLGEHVAEM